jgi:hypothetical protein
MSLSGSLATQVMVELSPGATFEGEEVRLVITGRLSAVDVLVQAVNGVSIKARTTSIKANLFIKAPSQADLQKNPLALQNEGTFNL